MEINILVHITALVTIAAGLPPLTKESSAQHEDSYIPGVFILTDSVKKIQDQIKNEKHKKEESSKIVSENEQTAKLQALYRKDPKANVPDVNSRPSLVNQAPVPLDHATNQEYITNSRLYANQVPSYQSPDLSKHKLYLSHPPTEKDQSSTPTDLSQQVYTNQHRSNQLQNPSSNQRYVLNPVANQPILLNQLPNQQFLSNPSPHQQYIVVTQPLNNQPVLTNQPLPNQPIVLGQQQYIPNQNSNPSQFVFTNQQPMQILTSQTQPTNQLPTQGLSNQPLIIVQQPTQTGQPIILTQQPNQAILVQPNQLQLQNGQLGQTDNMLVSTNQNGNQAALWPKPGQNQPVYAVVTLAQNLNPSANGNNYLVSVPSAGR